MARAKESLNIGSHTGSFRSAERPKKRTARKYGVKGVNITMNNAVCSGRNIKVRKAVREELNAIVTTTKLDIVKAGS